MREKKRKFAMKIEEEEEEGKKIERSQEFGGLVLLFFMITIVRVKCSQL